MSEMLKKAVEDPRIYAAYPEIERKILKKYPQLGKDLATTVLSITDIKSIQLSIGIQKSYELMSMKPAELDKHPELLYDTLPVHDLVRIRGGKSLQGTLLKQLGVAQIQHVVEKHIPFMPDNNKEVKKGLKERLFGPKEQPKQNEVRYV